MYFRKIKLLIGVPHENKETKTLKTENIIQMFSMGASYKALKGKQLFCRTSYRIFQKISKKCCRTSSHCYWQAKMFFGNNTEQHLNPLKFYTHAKLEICNYKIKFWIFFK